MNPMVREHIELVRYIASHPGRRVTLDFEDRVRQVVRYVNRTSRFFPTRRSVLAQVRLLTTDEMFGYFPDTYSRKQKEILDVLDYCCIYPEVYEPIN